MTTNELEQYILSACFWPEATADVLQSVRAEDFSVESNKRFFRAVEKVFNAGCVVDAVTVYDADKSFGSQYVCDISDGCPTVANIGFYLDKFREVSSRTKILRMADKIKSMRLEPVSELLEVIESATSDNYRSGANHISSAMSKAFKQMEEAYHNKGMITGIPTGISRIDTELSGLHKTDFILIAARPSIGKTALALQIAESACVTHKIPTLFISLEMGDSQLASRLVLSSSRVNVSKARNGMFKENEFGSMQRSAERINQAPFYVDDCAGVSIDQIVAKAKAEKQRNKIGLLIVDYLGLIGGKGTEYERTTEASKASKRLAKQLNIPIVCLHQLNRSNLANRPTMNELRSSGQLEQDADVIILLHRKKEEDIEPCELIIEKNRHGRTGVINQQWNGPFNRIEEVT
jgi:replicative DNA helicase